MFHRRLLAGLFVLGALAGLIVPATGQDKDKGKGKEDEKKSTSKDTGSGPLKWKFDPKKSFYQKMTTTTKQSMKVMNNDVNQTQTQTFYFKWTPTKVENDKVTIDQEITGVAMEIDIGGSKINYDSTKGDATNNPLGDFFKALVGSKFTVTLDTKKMQVTDIDGRDDFLKKLVAANPQMKPLLETILSKDALKEMAEPTFAVVPPGNEKSWKKTTTLDMGPIGKYENTYDYNLGAIDKNLANIKVNTTLKYTPPAEGAAQGGLPFKIKGADLKSTSASGNIQFNVEKGRVEKSTMNLELKGNLQIEIGGQTTKVELSQTQTSTVDTTDEDPLAKTKK
jgi:hypothetical protein